MSAQKQAQVKTTSISKPSFIPVQTGLLQRKCACGGNPGVDGDCEECRNKRLSLQRRAANQAAPSTVPPIVHEVLRSPGQPLDAATRTFMEPRFGHDFSKVQVHTDVRAAESARAVNALAYTVGRDVVFGARQYNTSTLAGRILLAHELTHVVQQGGQPTMLSAHLATGPAGDLLERESDRVALQVMRNQVASVVQRTQDSVIQRAQSVCSPTDLSPMDIGTHAHIQIQEQFIGWCRRTRSGIGDCAIENRIPLGSIKGSTGFADMARRSQLKEGGTVWELGEIKPISWLNRGDHRRAVRQLQNYIAAVRVHGETGVPIKTFLPSTPVGRFRGDPRLTLFATSTPEGIFYYWCEGEEDEEKKRKPKPVAVDYKIPIIIELAAEISSERWRIGDEMYRTVGPVPRGSDYVIIAPPIYFDMFIMEPRYKKIFEVHGLDPHSNPVMGFRNLGWTLITLSAGAMAAPAIVGIVIYGGELLAAGGVAAGGVAAGGATAGGGAEVISFAVFRAAATSAAAKQLAKAAGVLIVIGIVKEGKAEAEVSNYQAVRAVPLASIEPAGTKTIGSRVTYGGQQYYVIGRATAR